MPNKMKVTSSQSGGFDVSFQDPTKNFYFELTNHDGTKKYSPKSKDVQDLAEKIQKCIKKQNFELDKLDEVDFLFAKNEAEPAGYVLKKVEIIDTNHKSKKLGQKKFEKVANIFQNVHPSLSQAQAVVSSSSDSNNESDDEKEDSSTVKKTQKLSREEKAKEKITLQNLINDESTPQKNKKLFRKALKALDNPGTSDDDSGASTESDSDGSSSSGSERTKRQKNIDNLEKLKNKTYD